MMMNQRCCWWRRRRWIKETERILMLLGGVYGFQWLGRLLLLVGLGMSNFSFVCFVHCWSRRFAVWILVLLETLSLCGICCGQFFIYVFFVVFCALLEQKLQGDLVELLLMQVCGGHGCLLHILFSSRLLNTAHGLSCLSISQFDFHALDMLYCRNIGMLNTSTVLFLVVSCSDLFAAGFSCFFFFFTCSICVMDCQKTYLLPGQQDCCCWMQTKLISSSNAMKVKQTLTQLQPWQKVGVFLRRGRKTVKGTGKKSRYKSSYFSIFALQKQELYCAWMHAVVYRGAWWHPPNIPFQSVSHKHMRQAWLSFMFQL